MWVLSGFADEIDDDLEKQCAVLNRLGIGHIELRSAWGVNVLDLTDEQVDRAREILGRHDIAVSSIGSPIGKIAIADDFDEHLARMTSRGQVGHASARRTSGCSRSSCPDRTPGRAIATRCCAG